MLHFNTYLSCIYPDGILNFLKNNKPMDALCVLGLTLLDLYPCETWSFTFSKFLPGQGGFGVLRTAGREGSTVPKSLPYNSQTLSLTSYSLPNKMN